MSEPSVELQRGIYSALSASTTLAGAMGGAVRAYDRVPSNVVFPYLTISDAQVLDDSDACEPDMFDVFSDIHVWSRAVGMAEAKTISGIVRSLLRDIASVNDWTVTVASFETARTFEEPDGLTTHAVLTFKFKLQPA